MENHANKQSIAELSAQIEELKTRKIEFERQLSDAKIEFGEVRQNVTSGTASLEDLEESSRKVSTLETAIGDIKYTISAYEAQLSELKSRDTSEQAKVELKATIDQGLKALTESQQLAERVSVELRSHIDEIFRLRMIADKARCAIPQADPAIIKEVLTVEDFRTLCMRRLADNGFEEMQFFTDRNFGEAEYTAHGVYVAYQSKMEVEMERTKRERQAGGSR